MKWYEWMGLMLGVVTLILVFCLKLGTFPAITGGCLIGQFIGAMPFRKY